MMMDGLDVNAWIKEEESKLTPDSDKFYERGDPRDFPDDWFVDGWKLNAFAPIRAHLFMIKWRRDNEGGSVELPSDDYDDTLPFPIFPSSWQDDDGNLKPWAPIKAHLRKIQLWRQNIAASRHGVMDFF